MKFFGWVFGRDQEPDEVPEQMPWDQHPSIFEHIRDHLSPGTVGLAPGGDCLPDEERVAGNSSVRWAPGALDGVLGHHLSKGDHQELVTGIVKLVSAYCASPTAAAKAEIYRTINRENILSLVDPLIESLIRTPNLDHRRLFDLALSFAREGVDREVVKLGIALVGLFRSDAAAETVQVLGHHEEFTLFAAVALSRMCDDPDSVLWDLAKSVDGWGRIQLVERLAETDHMEIRRWMLMEGYRNSVMDEYLAWTCATAGGLLAALQDGSPDRALLTAAGDLLSALIRGGPAPDINSYEDGALAVESFIRHADSLGHELRDFLAVSTIRQFLDDDQANWTARAAIGWTPELRSALTQLCREILGRAEWRERAESGLLSDDEVVFSEASRVADILGIPAWAAHWKRLLAKTSDASRWYAVMAKSTPENITQIIDLAENRLALSRIASGPALEVGLGGSWEEHQCLDAILQELRRFSGVGIRLIETGLLSPVMRNRNLALAAMAEWGIETWPPSLRATLSAAAAQEPDKSIRERMNRLLDGESLKT